MVIEKVKNVLDSNAIAIAHQVNCKGVMGAGLAKELKNKKLDKAQYQCYQKICSDFCPKQLLGSIQILKSTDGQFVINLFGEDCPTGHGLDTDYGALKKALKNMECWCREHKVYYVAIPGYLGCGLAGGDWNIVIGMILEVFSKSTVTLEICYLPESYEQLTSELLSFANDSFRLSSNWHGFAAGTHLKVVKGYLDSIK